MTDVFADTHYFVSLVNTKDSAHQRAIEFTKSFRGRLTTTAWVLSEFANQMRQPRNRAEFLSVLSDLRRNTSVTIIDPSLKLFDDGIRLYATRIDKSWSLTDCISFVVMAERGLTDALTGDRHFEQAGFVALLK